MRDLQQNSLRGGRQNDELLCTKQVATLTGLSASFFEKRRVYGGGPPFLKVGGRIRYWLSDVLAWIQQGQARAGIGGEK